MKKIILTIYMFTSWAFSDICIVTTPNCKIKSITNKEIKGIFYGRRTKIDNLEIIPLTRDEYIISDKFYKTYFGITFKTIRNYWIKMIFTGRSKPHKFVSINELRNMLQPQDKCYISYKEITEPLSNWVCLNYFHE